MALFHLSFVPEPPTEAHFKSLLDKDALARKLISAFNFGGKDAALDKLVADTIGFLRLALASYDRLEAGNEAYLALRKNALAEAMKQCDKLSSALCRRIAMKGVFGDRVKLEYALLAGVVLDTHAACKGKWAQLSDLQRYISDKNMAELAHLWKPDVSQAGQELRGVTNAHLGEYLSGFSLYMHDKEKPAREAYNAWHQLLDHAQEQEALGVSVSVPCYPVYLEGYFDIPFGARETLLERRHNVVNYEGGEKRSRFHVEVVNGELYRTQLQEGAVVTTTRLTTPDDIDKMVFIIDAKKNLYVYDHIIGRQHHSSATMGRAVLCAGKLVAREGKITELNGHSGHYMPTARHVAFGVRVLHELGVLAPGATVNVLLISYPVKLYCDKLVQALTEGFTMENLKQACVSHQSSMSLGLLFEVLTNREFVHPEFNEAQELGEKNIERMITNRPRQELRVTKHTGPSLVKRTRQRANAMVPNEMPPLLYPLAQPPDPDVPVTPRLRRGAAFHIKR